MNCLRNALIALLLIMSVNVLAQQTPVSPDTLWAGGDGKFESAPDTALVQFYISVQQTDLKAAYAKAGESAQRIRGVLHDNGIDPKDAEIGSFNMTPAYDSSPKRKIVGYQVSSQVTVKVHDSARLGPIIESFSEAGSADSLNLSYILENMESAKGKAVEDAYQKAHHNAEALARAGGRAIGMMSYASVDVNELMLQPRPMMMKAQAMNRTAAEPSPVQDFTPSKITITAHVNVLFQLK
jgi:uncharacterized protein